MIIDQLQNCHRYFHVHQGFKEAFQFLQAFDKAHFEPKKLDIDGSNVRAIIELVEGKGVQKARLEAHRKYIDIQYVVQGEDSIGWRPCQQCEKISSPYDSEKDIEFFADSSLLWLPITVDSFAIFFPDDAHAPLAGEGYIKKIIMKIAV